MIVAFMLSLPGGMDLKAVVRQELHEDLVPGLQGFRGTPPRQLDFRSAAEHAHVAFRCLVHTDHELGPTPVGHDHRGRADAKQGVLQNRFGVRPLPGSTNAKPSNRAPLSDESTK